MCEHKLQDTQELAVYFKIFIRVQSTGTAAAYPYAAPMVVRTRPIPASMASAVLLTAL